MPNLTNYYPIINYTVISAVILLLYIWKIPIFATWLSQRTSNPFWKETEEKFRSISYNAIICAGLFGIFLNLPVGESTRVALITLLLIIWVFLSLRQIYQQYKESSAGRGFFIFIVSIVAIYAEFVGIGKLPHIWDLPQLIQTLPEITRNLIPIPIALLVGIFFHNVISPLIYQFTSKTETTLDDIAFQHLRMPFTLSIVYLGLAQTIEHVQPYPKAEQFINSLLLSIIIGIWSVGFWKAFAQILDDRKQKREDKGQSTQLFPLFNIIGKAFLSVTFIYWFLTAWGIPPYSTLASAGIVGIAVAYASQDTLGSLLAGIAILSDVPYKIGDFLILEDSTRGKVTQIGFRSTRLLTPENIEIIIPNSTMASSCVTNLTGGPAKFARIDINAGVAYGSDIDQVRTVLLEIGSSLKHVVKSPKDLKPQVHFMQMGASSLDFVLRVWLEDPFLLYETQDEANTHIYKTFTKLGIEIPYSKQDVYLYPMKSFPKEKSTDILTKPSEIVDATSDIEKTYIHRNSE
jgi:MscS family membrane protein